MISTCTRYRQTPTIGELISVRTSYNIGLSILGVVAFVTMCAASEVQVIRLASADAVMGAPSESCRPALTGQGGPVAWQILLLHNRAALAEMSGVAVDNRFPLCVFDKVKARDVELGVSFTPVAGKIDQAAGLMFRVRDANNYYVVRANALENNVNLYHVTNGVRRQIAGVGVPVLTGKTQQLGVRIEGDIIEVTFDGRLLIRVNDTTIQEAGAVGLWTKADSLTAFYELTVSVLKE